MVLYSQNFDHGPDCCDGEQSQDFFEVGLNHHKAMIRPRMISWSFDAK
jgi:hypothetical protein